MRDLEFIRAEFSVDLLVAREIEDILPTLTAAARKVSEAEKEMQLAPAERM
jgi:hypothetical protein